jgi:hypothetical protein
MGDTPPDATRPVGRVIGTEDSTPLAVPVASVNRPTALSKASAVLSRFLLPIPSASCPRPLLVELVAFVVLEAAKGRDRYTPGQSAPPPYPTDAAIVITEDQGKKTCSTLPR